MSTSTGVRRVVHLAPRTGWMNDPHGIVFREGRYHLFFQHVPDSLVWRPDIRWGHAVSDDLVHWEQLPDALSPDEDEAGCWSGGLVIDDDGNAVILYTSVGGHDHQLGRVRAAFPTDDTWLSWKQGAVVAEAPRSETVVFRDPAVFRDGNRWRMVVGFGDADGTAGAEVFVADNLTDWAYDGTLATRHGSEQDPWTGVAWECPQLLFPTGDRSVLVESSWENHLTNEVVAAVGAYADARFDAKLWQQLTAGGGHYAATRFLDAEGGNACSSGSAGSPTQASGPASLACPTPSTWRTTQSGWPRTPASHRRVANWVPIDRARHWTSSGARAPDPHFGCKAPAASWPRCSPTTTASPSRSRASSIRSPSPIGPTSYASSSTARFLRS